MRSFRDTAKRLWQVEINVDAVKRVRALLNIDLLDTKDGKIFERLSTDWVLLSDVLYVIVKPQADADGITDIDFGRALSGDVLDAATEATLEGLIDFFPQEDRRRTIRRVLEAMKSVQAKAAKALESKVDRLIEKASADAERMIHSELSTASPESSESTLAS